MAENVILTNLTNLNNGPSVVAAINNNNSQITSALADTLARGGSLPNQMNSILDMNSNRIINLPTPSTSFEPLRVIDVATPVQITTMNATPFNRSAISSNYTVQNTDKYKNIAAAGGFFTITFSPTASYDANFQVYIVNEDATRGKLISISGISNFILWPGQILSVFVDGSVWQVIGRSRFRVSGSIVLYVDVSLGNNNNDGLAPGAGNALQTIQQACNTILYNWDVTGASGTIIQLADGVYNEDVSVGGSQPGNVFTIQGNTGNSASVTILGQANTISVLDWAAVEVQNLTLGCFNNGVCISSQKHGIVDVGAGMIFGNSGVAHIFSANYGIVNLLHDYTISGSSLTHLDTSALINANPLTVTIPSGLSFNTAFCNSALDGGVNFGGCTFTGAGLAGTVGKRYTVDQSSYINTGGGGANYFPGSTAGTGTGLYL